MKTATVTELRKRNGEPLPEVTLYSGPFQGSVELSSALSERLMKRISQGFMYVVIPVNGGISGWAGKDGKGNESIISLNIQAVDPFNTEKDPCEGPCCKPQTSGEFVSNVEDALIDGQKRQARKKGAKVGSGAIARIDNLQPTPVEENGKKGLTLPEIPEGTYTAVFGEGGEGDEDYRTLEIERNENPDFFDGKGLKVSFLSGPDNERDFTSCAIIKENGQVIFWKKFRATQTEISVGRALLAIASDHRQAGEAYALKSGRCFRCGRKLTVPTSLHRGLGPECASKMGV